MSGTPAKDTPAKDDVELVEEVSPPFSLSGISLFDPPLVYRPVTRAYTSLQDDEFEEFAEEGASRHLRVSAAAMPICRPIHAAHSALISPPNNVLPTSC
jgi:hypothetical protein